MRAGGVFAGARLPSATALRGGAGEDDERDATELDERGLLVQHEQPEEHPDGGFEGHQGTERGGRHPAQGEHLERQRQHRHQDGQSEGGGEDPEVEVSGGLRNADDRCRGSGDGNGE